MTEALLAHAGLRRRAAAFVYEGVLLFGLVMITGLVYAGLSQQRHALHGRHGLQAALGLMMALYFVWFWSHGGQTVAMKAWSIRVTTIAGTPLTVGRAVARHVLSWLWFLPALLAASWAGLSSAWAVFGVLAAGIVGYAAFTGLNPGRQFLHDVVCGTCLLDTRSDAAPAGPGQPKSSEA